MNNFNAKKLLAVLSSAAVLAGAMPFMTTAVQAADTAAESTMLGDVNNDNKVSVADAVAILQFVANKDKFNLSAQAIDNADVYNRGDGVWSRPRPPQARQRQLPRRVRLQPQRPLPLPISRTYTSAVILRQSQASTQRSAALS